MFVYVDSKKKERKNRREKSEGDKRMERTVGGWNGISFVGRRKKKDLSRGVGPRMQCKYRFDSWDIRPHANPKS